MTSVLCNLFGHEWIGEWQYKRPDVRVQTCRRCNYSEYQKRIIKEVPCKACYGSGQAEMGGMWLLKAPMAVCPLCDGKGSKRLLYWVKYTGV